MKRILKWVGILIGSLVGVVILAVIGLYLSTQMRLNRSYDIQPESIMIPTDPASLAIGAHWADMHCRLCHGDDLGGGPFFDDPDLGYVDAPNLTRGSGGIAASYTDADWVRAIRHGVKSNGKSVFIMPSESFYFLSDQDLGSIIAYVKSVAPVDREIRKPALSPMAKVLYAVGAFGDLLYAETIPHGAPRPPVPAPGVNAAYGEYLVNAHGCQSCHGAVLSGKQPPEPGAPLAPNLTPGGDLAKWSEADFIHALRTGKTPSGHILSADFMPWEGLGKMTDDELKAVWAYLHSLPALATTIK